MMVKDVVVLQEAADDLKDGRSFYDRRQMGVGDYFWDSLISDMESPVHLCGHPFKTTRFLPDAIQEISLRNLLPDGRRHRIRDCSIAYAKRPGMA